MVIDFNTGVETLTDSQVDAEMVEIRNSDFYQNKNSKNYLPSERQKYLDRMPLLYDRKYGKGETVRQEVLEPDRGLHDTLTKEFGTTEKVENEADAARQAMADQVNEQIYKEADSELKQVWGPEYAQNIGTVHFIVDKIINPKDREMFIDTFGNNTEMCSLLAKIGKMLDETVWKNQAKNYKRSKESE
jgi:hypothetical protein